MPYREGLQWLGVAACAGGLSLLLLDFPMWGSMLRRPRGGQQAVQEEHYYLAVRHRGMGQGACVSREVQAGPSYNDKAWQQAVQIEHSYVAVRTQGRGHVDYG